MGGRRSNVGPTDVGVGYASGPAIAVTRVVREFGLSAREAEVLAALSEGRCTKEIAADLGLSRKTIEYFWTRIYAKLRCASQVEVMALLLRRACCECGVPVTGAAARELPRLSSNLPGTRVGGTNGRPVAALPIERKQA
jgi:DNA-binding CsgD family transcriptional regulator